MIPIIGDLISGVKDLLSEVIVDKDKKLQIDLGLAQLEDQAEARLDGLLQSQIEVNKIEAASGSIFVAGWRPAVGWVGAAGLLYSTILYPLGTWISRLSGYVGQLPVVDNQLLLYVLGGMLGLGGMRTLEKIKGVSTNDYTDVPKTQDTKKEDPVKPDPPKKFHFRL